jgi:hypothetical protein
MRHFGVLCLSLGILLEVIAVSAQNVNLKHRNDISAQKQITPDEMRDRAAQVQLQKDAKELSELCASIPPDMDGVKQGLLPKDGLDKLKRLEKLSKRVREELAQFSVAP